MQDILEQIQWRPPSWAGAGALDIREEAETAGSAQPTEKTAVVLEHHKERAAKVCRMPSCETREPLCHSLSQKGQLLKIYTAQQPSLKCGATLRLLSKIAGPVAFFTGYQTLFFSDCDPTSKKERCGFSYVTENMTSEVPWGMMKGNS